MAQLAPCCRPRRKQARFTDCQRSRIRSGRPVDLRRLAEDMLREMAFVYKAAHSVRQAMTEKSST